MTSQKPLIAERGVWKTPKHVAMYESPVRLLVLIAATLFVTHTIAMVMFAWLPQFPMWIESLVESILLLILLFPVLYYLSLRPLLMHIAERQQAEEVMRNSEHKFRLLFETLSDAAFLIDAETGRILDANHQAESLLGYGRSQIMGMNQSKLYPPGKNHESQAWLTSLAQHNGTSAYEAEIVAHAGKSLSVRVSGAPLMLYGRRLVLEVFHEINTHPSAA
ncbi:MAG: hypothetical protein PCFJNLEI_01178 [Verrucomicrobiae bacterium]|nr:hypothetical protein [Verrucomicrobiae bacterium]